MSNRPLIVLVIAVLAGLGVGSVAVALAAQKTLENLIGAITLYSARPVSPGDFCRFGKILGTVEEIGLRSTSIRTLDRTLVHVPNSVFSSMDIENFSARDRIRFFRNARLLVQTTDQARVVLAEIRRVLYSHPMVYPDTVSVRLDDIGEAAVQLRMDAGVKTIDFQEFLAVAEDLNLRFIDIVTKAGATLSGPGQLRILREHADAPQEHSEHVKDILAVIMGTELVKRRARRARTRIAVEEALGEAVQLGFVLGHEPLLGLEQSLRFLVLLQALAHLGTQNLRIFHQVYQTTEALYRIRFGHRLIETGPESLDDR